MIFSFFFIIVELSKKVNFALNLYAPKLLGFCHLFQRRLLPFEEFHWKIMFTGMRIVALVVNTTVEKLTRQWKKLEDESHGFGHRETRR